MADKKQSEKFEGTLKVLNFKEVKEGQKNHIVLFKAMAAIEGVGDKPEVLVDKEVWSADDFKDETEGPAKFEKVWKDDRQFFYALTSWGGKEKGGGSNRRGGGNGYGGAPKSKQEIYASSVSGIIKSGYDSCGNLGIKERSEVETHLKVGVELFTNAMKALGVE